MADPLPSRENPVYKYFVKAYKGEIEVTPGDVFNVLAEWVRSNPRATILVFLAFVCGVLLGRCR